MNKIARLFVGMGGAWFAAWTLMLLVDRMDSVWGIGTIGITDSLALIVLLSLTTFGMACIAAAISNRGE